MGIHRARGGRDHHLRVLAGHEHAVQVLVGVRREEEGLSRVVDGRTCCRACPPSPLTAATRRPSLCRTRVPAPSSAPLRAAGSASHLMASRWPCLGSPSPFVQTLHPRKAPRRRRGGAAIHPDHPRGDATADEKPCPIFQPPTFRPLGKIGIPHRASTIPKVRKLRKIFAQTKNVPKKQSTNLTDFYCADSCTERDVPFGGTELTG
ncbi:unnamed protein product [Chondrus crispus]|uniref:Uncharacterized protein n=1 Tax=Chondrus crispus TaxID=2769 RepID=R7QBG7_CHOCR|nr:unnamed protein product [Chondrus crispus]CDF34810.1 unnamed protein product [Chondrus crispus]|eukprot:XP_005714629.1 unnamed protein product [Chondrus crispus]